MTGVLSIVTQHADVPIRLTPAGWHATCPQCEWTGHPHRSIAAAIRDADRHSDDALARGLEDPPGAKMPDPRRPR